MKNSYFPLEIKDNSKITKVFQFILGVVCILIAFYWLIFNISSVKDDNTSWITILFLVSFGAYEILAGLGKTLKYINISEEKIILKQNPVLPPIEIKASELLKIELHPLKISFSTKNNKYSKLRFGVSYAEIINPVKDAVEEFAEFNKIPVEIIIEEV